MADKRLDQTTNASAVAAADNIPFVTAAGVTSYVTGDELAASGPFSSRYKPLASDSVFIPANDLHATTGTASMGTLGNATNAYSRAPVRVFVSAGDTITWAWAEMPLGWATFDIYVWWSNAGTGSGNVRFACNANAFADNETTDSDASTSATFSTVVAPARYITKRSKLNGSAIAADSGELLRVLVMRNGSSGADTLTNDIGVVGVELVRVS